MCGLCCWEEVAKRRCWPGRALPCGMPTPAGAGGVVGLGGGAGSQQLGITVVQACVSARAGEGEPSCGVQLWAVAGAALVPAPALMCALCCVVLVWFFFLFAHVFFFFPTISPACLPSMPLLHAPVCKLVGWVGASPPSPACASHMFWGEGARFGSTHSGLIYTCVTLSPSSVAGEDELGQHSVAPACSFLGLPRQDQPW